MQVLVCEAEKRWNGRQGAYLCYCIPSNACQVYQDDERNDPSFNLVHPFIQHEIDEESFQ